MALPGLGLTAPTATPTTAPVDTPPRSINLSSGSEFRFEVPFTSTLTLTLIPTSPTDSPIGTAEIFGTELAPNHAYTFIGTKAAVYTHHGCTLQLSGSTESEYIAEETPLTEYANVHFALEDLRAAAVEARAANVPHSGGPRVLLLGPPDAGKTSVLKTLAAYATRAGRAPLVVNLDPREGMLCLPGCVSAAVLGSGSVLDIEEGNGWGSSPIAGPSTLPVKMPLVYHVGCERPEEAPEVFRPVVTRLALAATSRFEDDDGCRESGLFVDMAGSTATTGAKDGYEIVQHVVSEFSINVLLVLGSERLYSDMTRRFASAATASSPQIHVLRLSKSGGCVDRDELYMRAVRTAQIRAYFFGSARNTLSPHTQILDLGALSMLRMTDPNDTPFDFLPGGAEDTAQPAAKLYTPTTPSLGAQNAILTLKHATPGDAYAAIRDASVLGHLYVADVDDAKKKVKILSPVGGRLPTNAIVWGRWPEGVGDLVG